MGRRLTDKGAYLRDAIATILAKAKEPLDAVEIAQHELIADVEYTASDVSEVLARMNRKAKKPHPIKRIRVSGPKNTRWKYYNPDVVQPLEDRPRGKRATPPAPDPVIPPAAPPEFQFDPVPLAQELQKPTVEVPPGVKSITVKVGWVSILIELDGTAVAR